MILRISQKQLQKTILAPSMQQSIEILMLPILELNTAIELELQENPLLEIDEEKELLKEKALEDAINKSLERAKDLPDFTGYRDNFDDEDVEKIPIRYDAPLEEYLLRQLHLEVSDSLEIQIGEYIIGNLDEDGYLDCSIDNIQQKFQLENTDSIIKVLEIIQNFEPVGIAARDVKECLCIQAAYKYNGKSDVLIKMINDHMDSLGKKKYDLIARKLKMNIDRVKEVASWITALEPKPARNYRPLKSSIYIKPDVTIQKDELGEYNVLISRESIPPLRISKLYSNLLNTSKCSKEEREYIKEKVKNAILFIKSIEQRHNTLKEIASYIAKNQSEFFSLGHMHLKPMILKDVAQAIDRNESTVSRAINNKYIDTPCGLFPIKYFFSQSIKDNVGVDVSNTTIKEELKALIDHESKDHPLSDQEIHCHFERKNMKVARRTITKYRKFLKILPAYLRKM